MKSSGYYLSLQIAADTTLDRERQSVLRLYAIASDVPEGGAEQRSARVLITVDVLDVNDNAPMFPQDSYTAVIPENAPTNTSVVNITASDPDEGPGGVIHFDIIDEGEANGTRSFQTFIFLESWCDGYFDKLKKMYINVPFIFTIFTITLFSF